MDTDLDLRIIDLASRQAGRFSRAQALAAGASPTQVTHRLRSGLWERLHPGVYGLRRWPSTPPLDRLWAAHLFVGPGAVVSHESAARLHGWWGVACPGPVLTVAHGTHLQIRGVTVHQSRDHPLEPAWIDRRTVPALPVTSPARTALDLAAVLRPARLQLVLDENRSAGRLDLLEVGECLQRFARPGKRGVRRLATVLDDLLATEPAPSSELERGLFALLDAHGLPRPIPQFPHPGATVIDGCVDGAYPAERLILEADGRRWHSRAQDLRRDAERDAEAAAAGWLTLRLLHEHINGAPDQAAQRVRATLEVRRRQLGLAA